MKLTIETFIGTLHRWNGAVYEFTTEQQGNAPAGTGLNAVTGWIQGAAPPLGTPVTVTIEWNDDDS